MSGYVSIVQEGKKIVVSLFICDSKKVVKNQIYSIDFINEQTIFNPLLSAVEKYNEFADILRKSCGCSVLQCKEIDVPNKKIKTRMLFYKSKY
jgi:hypothetical protein